MHASALDRPIERAEEDDLGLGPFVEGLARALLSDDRRRTRGVVIGLEGEWGSGKSSILNLIEKTLQRLAKESDGPEPTIVRFDPWLVSGRDDLIAGFLRALVDAIDPIGRERARAGSLVSKIARYGEMLAPAFSLLGPPVGAALGGAMRAVAHAAAPTGNPFDLRKTVEEALAGFDRPIVVLIDELDRIEDAEVRTMAQLVRSVMDFPSISYLLAYDPQRVAEALGGGPSEEQRRRGEAYLEKIVQLRVPVPAPPPDKLLQLLEEDFRAIVAAAPVARQIDSAQLTFVLDLAGGTSAANDPLIRSLRDVERTPGIFAALEPMLCDEIDRVDLLGWSILLAKRPVDVERLKARLRVLCASVPDGAGLVRLVTHPADFKVRLPLDDKDSMQTLLAEVHPLCRYLVWNSLTIEPPIPNPHERPPSALCWQHRLLVAATSTIPAPLFPVATVRKALSSPDALTQAFEEASRSRCRLGFFIALGIARRHD